MSAYENVVVGKLRLKGKALDVKAGGIKKKKKHKKQFDQLSQVTGSDRSTGGNISSTDHADDVNDSEYDENNAKYDDQLTPAERRFLERTEKLELQRLSKMAAKSHRDRIQEFNQYLANLSEHYDIPKVGPG